MLRGGPMSEMTSVSADVGTPVALSAGETRNIYLAPPCKLKGSIHATDLFPEHPVIANAAREYRKKLYGVRGFLAAFLAPSFCSHVTLDAAPVSATAVDAPPHRPARS